MYSFPSNTTSLSILCYITMVMILIARPIIAIPNRITSNTSATSPSSSSIHHPSNLSNLSNRLENKNNPRDSHPDFSTVDLHFGDKQFVIDDWWFYEMTESSILSKLEWKYSIDEFTPDITACSYRVTIVDMTDMDDLKIMNIVEGQGVIERDWYDGILTIHFDLQFIQRPAAHIHIECNINPDSWTNQIRWGFGYSHLTTYTKHPSGQGSSTWNIFNELILNNPLPAPPGFDTRGVQRASLIELKKKQKDTSSLIKNNDKFNHNTGSIDKYWTAYGISLITMANFTLMSPTSGFLLKPHSKYLFAIDQDPNHYCIINGVNIAPEQLHLKTIGDYPFGASVKINPTSDQIRAITAFNQADSHNILDFKSTKVNELQYLSIECTLIQLRAPTEQWSHLIEKEPISFSLQFNQAESNYQSVTFLVNPMRNPSLPSIEVGGNVGISTQRDGQDQTIEYINNYVDFDFTRLPDPQLAMLLFNYNSTNTILFQTISPCSEPKHKGQDVIYQAFRNMGASLDPSFHNASISQPIYSYNFTSFTITTTLNLNGLIASTTSKPFSPSRWKVFSQIPCNRLTTPQVQDNNNNDDDISLGADSSRRITISTMLTTPANLVTNEAQTSQTTWSHVLPIYTLPSAATSITLTFNDTTTSSKSRSSFTLTFDHVIWPLAPKTLNSTPNDYINSTTSTSLLGFEGEYETARVDELHLKFSFALRSYAVQGIFGECYLGINDTKAISNINNNNQSLWVFDHEIPITNDKIFTIPSHYDDDGAFDGSGAIPIQSSNLDDFVNFKFVISRVGYEAITELQKPNPSFTIVCRNVNFTPVDVGLITHHDYLTVTTWVNHNNTDDTYETTLRRNLVEFFTTNDSDQHQDGQGWKLGQKLGLIFGVTIGGLIIIYIAVRSHKTCMIRAQYSSYHELN